MPGREVPRARHGCLNDRDRCVVIIIIRFDDGLWDFFLGLFGNGRLGAGNGVRLLSCFLGFGDSRCVDFCSLLDFFQVSSVIDLRAGVGLRRTRFIRFVLSILGSPNSGNCSFGLIPMNVDDQPGRIRQQEGVIFRKVFDLKYDPRSPWLKLGDTNLLEESVVHLERFSNQCRSQLRVAQIKENTIRVVDTLGVKLDVLLQVDGDPGVVRC